MTDEQAIKLAKWVALTTERLDRMQAQLNRIEAAMLKREDLHPSNRSQRPMTQADEAMAEWESAQAGEQREGGE